MLSRSDFRSKVTFGTIGTMRTIGTTENNLRLIAAMWRWLKGDCSVEKYNFFAITPFIASTCRVCSICTCLCQLLLLSEVEK